MSIVKVKNPIQYNIAFHVETSHVIHSANEMGGFYMKSNWAKIHWSIILNYNFQQVYPCSFSEYIIQLGITCLKLAIETVE